MGRSVQRGIPVDEDMDRNENSAASILRLATSKKKTNEWIMNDDGGGWPLLGDLGGGDFTG